MSVSEVSIEKAWKEYYTYGGLPLVLTLDSDKKKSEYLKNLYQTVYAADILERHNIRNKEEFNELVSVVASSIGSPTNPRKLSNTFHSLRNKKLTHPTIGTYLQYLQDAFIIEKGMRYDVKGKKYINTLSKYYFTDIGVRNAILNFRQQEENHIMENIIYNELKIRGFQDLTHTADLRTQSRTLPRGELRRSFRPRHRLQGSRTLRVHRRGTQWHRPRRRRRSPMVARQSGEEGYEDKQPYRED